MENLKILYLRVNQYCNAHCFMCDFWKNKKIEIEEEEFEDILKKVGNVEMIRFTGGEPLLCDKLPQYIEKCHSKGIKTSIITNGFLLEKKIDDLVEKGLDQIVISVDGSTAEIHDNLRGVKGLFDKINKILDLISDKYPLLLTRVNTVVSEKNLKDIPKMAKWLDEKKVKQWSIIPIKLDNHRWCDKISLEEFKEQYEIFKKQIKHCNVELMGYSGEWAGSDIEEFWKGNSFIRPKGNCNITKMVRFYNPFKKSFYPCNCIPHRDNNFENTEEENEWYFKHGHEFCKGCEPLNAYCADYPQKVNENIFNF